MILTKSVKIKPSGKSIKYYRDRGYDAQWHQELEVSVDDLPENSNVIVEVQCDYENCRCTENIHYSKYTKNVKQNNGMFYCKNCWLERFPQIIFDKYGVYNVSQLDSIKEKKCQTMLQHYGVKYSFQSPELVERIKQFYMDNYGTRNVAELDFVKEKRKKTNLEKYGCENPNQSKEVIERRKKTNLQRYGVEYQSQNPLVRKKVAETLSANNTVSTSSQQKYIHKLYGGELNGVVSHYNCDIVFREDKVILEYDGGGHLLGVKLGKESYEDSMKKQMIRDLQIKREGYRIIRIISRKDLLPSDSILLSMLQYAKDFFSLNPERTWISFDVDNNCIYNAYHKEGDTSLYYNFGELRKLKKSETPSLSDN